MTDGKQVKYTIILNGITDFSWFENCWTLQDDIRTRLKTIDYNTKGLVVYKRFNVDMFYIV